MLLRLALQVGSSDSSEASKHRALCTGNVLKWGAAQSLTDLPISPRTGSYDIRIARHDLECLECGDLRNFVSHV
jgi:hypothetical protein